MVCLKLIVQCRLRFFRVQNRNEKYKVSLFFRVVVKVGQKNLFDKAIINKWLLERII